MPAVAAYPLIAAGISAAGSAYAAHKASSAAKNAQAAATKGNAPLIGAQTDLARQQAAQGKQLFSFGMPQLNKAAGYYGGLLGGSRSAVAGALAPDVANLRDIYAGADRNLDRMAPGAGRDVAAADLNRQRAGQIGGLALAVRPNAAAQLASLGQVGVSGGMAGGTGAAGIYSNLVGQNQTQQRLDFDQQQLRDQQASQFGQNLSKIIGDFIQAYQARQGSQPRTVGGSWGGV